MSRRLDLGLLERYVESLNKAVDWISASMSSAAFSDMSIDDITELNDMKERLWGLHGKAMAVIREEEEVLEGDDDAIGVDLKEKV